MEITAVIIGSLDSNRREISCKFGQSVVGKVVTTGATVVLLKSLLSNFRVTVVVMGQMNKGIDDMGSSVMHHKYRVFRFGSNGSPVAQSCRAEDTP